MTTHREPKAPDKPGEEGAALVEFAFVFPIFILILFGLISFGMILGLKQSVTNASAEGARAAIGATKRPSDLTLVDAQKRVATARARGALTWIGPARIGVTTFDPQVAPCVNDTTKQCITVTVKYP
ncbi:MAG: TadE/TadG family type IV pilus assembly protein, partial [Pseudonocardiaceae bacterium]